MHTPKTSTPPWPDSKANHPHGEPIVWLSGCATLCILCMFLAVVVISARYGLASFWASPVMKITTKDGGRYFGNVFHTNEEKNQLHLYVANRERYGGDFIWLQLSQVISQQEPAELMVVERFKHGRFIGLAKKLALTDQEYTGHAKIWEQLNQHMPNIARQRDLLTTTESQIAEINRLLMSLRREDPLQTQAKSRRLQTDHQRLMLQLNFLRKTLADQILWAEDARGGETAIPLVEIVRIYRPNQMSIWRKTKLYLAKFWELLSQPPRGSNREGGLFPAIFGTVLMIFLMSLFGVPLGIVAAIYMNEYAKEGPLLDFIRIAVNHLAGVPSIVYGVFGLGFFVYGIGGSIDALFFSSSLPLPTFGTGGLLWASLTMALLTVPVVIVATEESLKSIPKGIRESSMALGATRFQTLTRVIIPIASPGMITGVILSIARAAGEVAPLMLVGVTKSVQTLPIDGVPPFIHLEQKFMHLGFHIFDLSFHSPSPQAAQPMVYMTSFLLLSLVLSISLAAMFLRQYMQRQYTLNRF